MAQLVEVTAIVTYRSHRGNRKIHKALEIPCVVASGSTLREIGGQIGPVVASHLEGLIGYWDAVLARIMVTQVCVYHRGSFIGSLTPQWS